MKLSRLFFEIRSYTPIPFFILMLAGEHFTLQTLIIGFALAILGEAIRFWGVSWAGSETRTRDVGGTFLIVSGPFAYVRNPLYIGNTLMYVGFAIGSNAFFPYLQIITLLFFYIQYHFIVQDEEKYLNSTFKEYQEYKSKVPRFFPRLTPFKLDNKIKQPNFNLKAGLRSETRTLQAFALLTVLLIVIHYFKH